MAHIEGATGFDADGQDLEMFYQAGVRSLGPFWNLPSRFGEGVNGAFQQSPDTSKGLTTDGVRLIRHANQLKMLIDVSHMNEKAFWDTLNYSSAPIIATHSNAYSLCRQPRNLTDRQLTAIAQRDGLVAVNFGNAFLRADGQRNGDTPLSVIVDHIDYLVAQLSIERVALGSDFDGTCVPDALKDVTGLPRLFEQLQQRGYTDTDIEKLSGENWLAALKRVWG